MTQGAWDQFAADISPAERSEVLQTIHASVFGKHDSRVALMLISLADVDTRLAEGILRWGGTDHSFTVEVFAVGSTLMLSWNENRKLAPYPALNWTVAPQRMLIDEAIGKGRQEFLCEKWDAFLQREDVGRVLARFTFDAHIEPGGDRPRHWREKVENIGFEIVSAADAARVRKELVPETPLQEAAFHTRRKKKPLEITFRSNRVIAGREVSRHSQS